MPIGRQWKPIGGGGVGKSNAAALTRSRARKERMKEEKQRFIARQKRLKEEDRKTKRKKAARRAKQFHIEQDDF